MNNLIFLGGPHGSGKTTLARVLEGEIPKIMIPELKTQTPKFYSNGFEGEVDFFHRQCLKHAQRAIENYEYMQIATENPNKIVLGNRCIYDVLAYDQAYFKTGWISEDEWRILSNSSDYLFNRNLKDPNVIVLNPSFEICKMHLEQRWKSENKKFMEKDMNYLRAVCDAYEKYRGKDNIFYIDYEIDLNRNVKGLKKWVDMVYRRELQVVGV